MRFVRSVLEGLHGGGQPAAPVDEHRGVALVHRHDGAIAQQAAKVQLFAGLAADGGDHTHRGGLGVDHADGRLVGDQAADDRGGGVAGIILFILSGVIAELLLWKMGYGNAKALTVSYVINQVLAAFGSTIIPYAIAAKAMANQMVTDGRQDAILAASQMLQSWVSVALVAGVIVAAFIGAMIGKRIVKKHLAA